MPIETKDLVIYESERLTDNDDGGGKYNGKVIVDGRSNNLFDDISELDRTMGSVSLRKIFPAVTTADTDKLMGATVFVSELPKDPNVSALLFSTKNWTDQRKSAQNRIENYLAKGSQVAGTPLDTHWLGMKTLQVAMFPSEQEMSPGATIVLISNEGKALMHEQYARILKVESRIAKMIIDQKEVEYKAVTYTLSDALEIDYVGLTAKQWYNGEKSITILRDTLVADTGKYFSSAAITQDIQIGSTVAQAKSIFAQLVPSAQTETPLINLNVSGTSTALMGASQNLISRQITAVIGTNTNTFIGSPILPGSLSFQLDANAVTDKAGELKTSAGISVGTIEYDKGLIKWNAGAGTGSKTITFNFTPASARNRVSNTDFIEVTKESQSLNYVRTLDTAPARGSLAINYTAQKKTYTLRDDGTGGIGGGINGIGVGTVDYINGTVAITFSALPDVGTDIIFYWADDVAYSDITARQVNKLSLEYSIAKPVDTTGVLKWAIGADNYTANVALDGTISGHATGQVIDQKVILKPNLLIPVSTQINFEYTAFTSASIATGNKPGLLAGEGIEISGKTYQMYQFTLDSVKQNAMKFSAVLSSSESYLATANATIEAIISNEFYYKDISGEIFLTDSTYSKKLQKVGTINYTTKVVKMAAWATGVLYRRTVKTTGGYYKTQTTGVESINVVFAKESGSQDFKYSAPVDAVSEAITTQLNRTSEYCLFIDKDQGMGLAEETISLRINNQRYFVSGASVYTSMDTSTGSGIASGIFDSSAGRMSFTGMIANSGNQVQWESVSQVVDSMPQAFVVFKIPTVPIRPLSFQLLIGSPAVINVTADQNGNITHNQVKGTVNYENGTVKLYFTEQIQSVNEVQLQEYFDKYSWFSEANYSSAEGAGLYTVFLPSWFSADEIKYNAVSFSYIPLDPEVLGISATRLPSDGQVPIFRVGDIAVISASKDFSMVDHVAGKTYQLPDTRISWCELIDSKGMKVPFDMYVVDYDYGKFTLSGDFAVNALTPPFTAQYRYQDMLLISDVQINGQLTFAKQITHNYSTENTIVGSALVIDDMQARYTNKFVQQTWSSVWADEGSGGGISANYNDAIYPIAMTNQGAIQERFAIVFTSGTTFKCVGEYSGEVGTGSTTIDFFPLNPITNAPYFTIKKEGWGSGWANGNVMRFNTIASNFPIWAIRTVKQSEPTELADQFQIMLRGDIDRVV